MATYATYFHFPPTPMVHSQPLQSCALESVHSAFKLQSAEPRVRQPTLSRTTCVMSNAKRVAVPKDIDGQVSEQTGSHFFRLPAELRNQIYTELLCPGAIRSKDLAKSRRDLAVRGYNQTCTPTHLYPQILSTCKKIKEEAEGLLYSTHIFHAHPSLLTSLPHLQSAAQPVLYPRVTKQINRWQISLRLDIDPQFTFEQAKKAFSGAEYLEIRVWQSQFDACDFSVLKLFTGIRNVKIARVGGSVSDELARWLEHLMTGPEKVEDKCGCWWRDGGMSGCPGFEGKQEVLCGKCYRKVGVEWLEMDWDLWRFGGR